MEHSVIYSIPYVILVLIYGILSFLYQSYKDEKALLNIRVICICIFLFFFGFRGFVGDDWTNYYHLYEKLDVHGFQELIYAMQDTAYEPGFFFLSLLCYTVSGGSYFFYNFVCCALCLFLLYKFLRRYVENIPLGFLLYICMGGFVMSTNLMRNSISILIFANTVHLLAERKALKYFLACLLALCFHYSALIYFPLYFFFHKRTSKWVFLGVLLFGNVIFLLRVQYITPLLLAAAGHFGDLYEDMLEAYIEGKYADMATALSVGHLERMFTAVLIFCYYDKLHKIRKENAILMNSFLVFFCLYLFLWEFQVVSQRIATLFTYFYWVLWADLMNCFSFKNNKRLFIGFVSIYSVLKITGYTSLETLNYDNVLFEHKSYEERLYIHQKYEDDEDEL